MIFLAFQWILLGLVVVFSCYSIFRIIKKNFSPNKFKSKRTGCDRDCGCS